MFSCLGIMGLWKVRDEAAGLLEEMGLGFWGIWVFPEQEAQMGSACEEGLSRD